MACCQILYSVQNVALDGDSTKVRSINCAKTGTWEFERIRTVVQGEKPGGPGQAVGSWTLTFVDDRRRGCSMRGHAGVH